MAKYTYTGSDERVYPEYLYFGGSLVAEPGMTLDFGNEEPPGDGLWAEAKARAKAATPPPAPAEQAQPLSSTSSDAEAATGTTKEAN